MVLPLLFHLLVQFCSFSGYGKQCSVAQRNVLSPLHLQSHSLSSSGAFCLSFAPYPESSSISWCVHLHKGVFIPAKMLAHHLVLDSEGNACGKIRCSSMEKQDWFPTVTLWLYFALQPSGCTGNCSGGGKPVSLIFKSNKYKHFLLLS